MTEPTETSTDTATGTYTPVFSPKIRTVIYVVALVGVIAGLGVSRFVDPEIGDYVVTACGLLASGFGVAYNPIRLASK